MTATQGRPFPAAVTWVLAVQLMAWIGPPPCLAVTDGEAAESGPADPGSLWDHRHSRASAAVAGPVDRVDRFFGDERLGEENRGTRLHTTVGLKIEDDRGASLLTDFRLRLALPRLQHRVQLFLDERFTSDEPDKEDSISEAIEESEPDGHSCC